MAQIETAATTVTDVEHALELYEQRRIIVEFATLPVECMASGSLEAPLAIARHRVLRHGDIAVSA
jgi:hypothetical protein